MTVGRYSEPTPADSYAAKKLSPQMLAAIDQTSRAICERFDKLGIDLGDKKIAAAVRETLRLIVVADREGPVLLLGATTALAQIVQAR